MKLSSNMTLYAITPHDSNHIFKDVWITLEGGVHMIQYRDKTSSPNQFFNRALQLSHLCKKKKIPLILNDYVHFVHKTGASGAHIGQNDLSIKEARRILGPEKILGVTAKTVAQAKRAESLGADYLGCGSIFPSITKKEAQPMSIQTLCSITQAVSIPVFAIGGIQLNNISVFEHTGIRGAAVCEAIFKNGNIHQNTKHFQILLQNLRP
ncbi:MAG: thiamine phosphate synthase [Tissierellia bacterium]|nr:thiamine phosphate synthase [Tissierellia bacterium]